MIDVELKPLIHGPHMYMFRQNWKAGNYSGQRVGQAFYDYFHMDNAPSLKDLADKLYELDGEDAFNFIEDAFHVSW